MRNQTALREYVYHRFAITLDSTFKLFHERPAIEEIVRTHYAPYRESAARANATIERRTGSDLPDPAPLVRFSTTDLGKGRIEITVFCPPGATDNLENEITWEVVNRLQPEQGGAEIEREQTGTPEPGHTT